MKPISAEFLGTFFFCAVALLSGNPLAAALVLTAMVYALGYISGGHFNPAVSMAVWLRGQMDIGELLKYCGAQLGGATAAYLLFWFLGSGPAGGSSPEIPYFRAFAGETVFMFLPAFVYLHVRTARQQAGNGFFGAAVGLSWYAGSSALSRLSAGACNPALGLAYVFAGLVPAWMLFLYPCAALVAGAGAAIAYRLLNPND